MVTCAEADCDAEAAVELHIPWDQNRRVCPAHARSWAQRDGVVPEPLADADTEWP